MVYTNAVHLVCGRFVLDPPRRNDGRVKKVRRAGNARGALVSMYATEPAVEGRAHFSTTETHIRIRSVDGSVALHREREVHGKGTKAEAPNLPCEKPQSGA